jgi:hydroxypyruvate reductase
MHKMIDLLNMSTIVAPGFQEKLEAIFRVHTPSPSGLTSEMRKARAIIPDHTGVDADLMNDLPMLEIISTIGVGYDHVDVREATRRGIVVTNTPDVLTDDVADLAIALMIVASRNIITGDQIVRTGNWKTKDPVIARTVSRKKLGIFGLGRIGKAIATRAAAMNMDISYCNRNKADTPYRFVANIVELARDSDFLIVAASAGTSTRHIINRQVLEALGPTGILINVARGSLVDELAMTEMLLDRKLGGAGLDVFEYEPNVPAALFKPENVVLTPHLGSGTVETRIAMGDLTLKNLCSYFDGHPLPSEVPESKSARAAKLNLGHDIK